MRTTDHPATIAKKSRIYWVRSFLTGEYVSDHFAKILFLNGAFDGDGEFDGIAELQNS
jgi:hypothetical protein